MASARSPSPSSRLPSPPPIAEDQIGPTSPGVSLYEEQGDGQSPGINSIDSGAARRIRPGTKAEDIHEGPPLVPLQEIDSAFQLTEHLKALYHHHTHPPDTDTTVPLTADLARQLAQPPAGTAKEIWLYELGRFLIQKANTVIVHLFADSPPCSAQTCPEMRASEWQYLCAVHDPPKSCSAIDYCCHTLDWAALALTSSKMFPSRLGLGSGQVSGNDKVLAQQMKEITNIFRRVYRIYAHAWFQHREMFWRVEGKTGLYVFFKTVCDEYGMIQPENYTIPPEAEGRDAEQASQASDRRKVPHIMTRVSEMDTGTMEPAGNRVTVLGNTTKHRPDRAGPTGHGGHVRNPSSTPTTVIQEEAEEEEESTDVKLNRTSTIFHALPALAAEGSAPEDPLSPEDDTDSGSSRRDTLRPDVVREPPPEIAVEPVETEQADETTIMTDEPEIAPEPVQEAASETANEPKAEAEAEAEPAAEPTTESAPEPVVEPVIEAKPDEADLDVKVETVEVTAEAAADGDEAGKSVAD